MKIPDLGKNNSLPIFLKKEEVSTNMFQAFKALEASTVKSPYPSLIIPEQS